MPTPAEVEAYIRQAATARGVPADIAVAIARAESGLRADAAGDWWVDQLHYPAGTPVIARTGGGFIVPAGTPGAVATSFGPFQLRAGRHVTGDPQEAGLGDSAVNGGVDVTNPATWQQQVDFALNYAAQRGTFAGTWSTAVGALAQTFTGGHAVPIGASGAPPVTEPPGAPLVPSMPEPGAPLGPGPAQPTAPIVVPPPFSGIGDTLGSVAGAIAALPAGLIAPVVDELNRTNATLSWLGQTHVWERIGLVLLGGVAILVGLVLTGVSFVPKGTPLPVPV